MCKRCRRIFGNDKIENIKKSGKNAGFFYIFFNLNDEIIKMDKIIIMNKYECGGRYGIPKKLNVSRQPAAVIGIPVKYPLLSVMLKRARR